MTIRILLAEDHHIVRQALRELLVKEPGLVVVGEARNGREAVHQANALKPNLVVMDVSMPELNGIEATRQIVRIRPGIKILALSVHADHRTVEAVCQAGAKGYLLKNCLFEEFKTAILAVMRGEKYLSPDIKGLWVQDPAPHHPKSAPDDSVVLSAREREVLRLVAEGKSTAEIAGIFGIGVKTVETHRLKVKNKLGSYDVAGLTRWALQEGLTTL